MLHEHLKQFSPIGDERTLCLYRHFNKKRSPVVTE